ncbi:MAG: hypothetical protein IID36_05930 [Planctomycetes bacterium]|nr:hypothetical protein [Planctomycetota bacterium]
MSKPVHLITLFAMTVALGGCSTQEKRMQPAVVADAERNTATAADEGSADAGSKEDADDAKDDEEKEKSEAKKKAEKDAKRAKLTRDLAIAKVKIAQAEMALDHQHADDEETLRKTAADRDVAAAKLEDFEKRSMPVRLDKARLALQRADDGVRQSREELEQLEMMYAESELGDKTREIVIIRAKRRLERAEWNLRIQQAEMNNLEKNTIPLEHHDLQLKYEAAAAAHTGKSRSAKSSQFGKTLAIMSAESEVVRLETELANMDLE